MNLEQNSDFIVKVVNTSNNQLPEYTHPSDAGFDLRADFTNLKIEYLDKCDYDTKSKQLLIYPGGRCLIPTGLHIKLPEGFELQIRPRSGLALKNGITIVNSPGTIDENYTGDIGIILLNTSSNVFVVSEGDRIAQGILSKVYHLRWEKVDSLEITDRNSKGFGESGIK